MPIVVTCPGCSTTLKAPDAAAGKKVKCPKCTSAVPVPAADSPPVIEEDEVVEEAPAAPRRSSGAVSTRRREAEVEAGPDEPPPDWQSNRMVCGIVAIVIGSLGIHKFILGNTTPAIIMLLVTLLGSCAVGLGPLAMMVIGIIEGIKYLQMSDAEFYRTYVVGKKPWF
jgi:TM2 domain-containing membrane protein YozV